MTSVRSPGKLDSDDMAARGTGGRSKRKATCPLCGADVPLLPAHLSDEHA